MENLKNPLMRGEEKTLTSEEVFRLNQILKNLETLSEEYQEITNMAIERFKKSTT
jgi:hypothetical protein